MLGKEEEEETAGIAVAGLFCRGCKMDGTLLEFCTPCKIVRPRQCILLSVERPWVHYHIAIHHRCGRLYSWAARMSRHLQKFDPFTGNQHKRWNCCMVTYFFFWDHAKDLSLHILKKGNLRKIYYLMEYQHFYIWNQGNIAMEQIIDRTHCRGWTILHWMQNPSALVSRRQSSIYVMCPMDHDIWTSARC